MTIINQTNRTLLLEEINPEKLDLLTLIGDVKGIDSLSDDKIKEINQYLECRSYEEFQEKFAPCIYSFFDANTQSVRYTLKKPENGDPAESKQRLFENALYPHGEQEVPGCAQCGFWL